MATVGPRGTFITSGERFCGPLSPTCYTWLGTPLHCLAEPRVSLWSCITPGHTAIRRWNCICHIETRLYCPVCMHRVTSGVAFDGQAQQNSSLLTVHVRFPITWLRMTHPSAGQIVICSCHLAWADPRIVLPSGSAGSKGPRGWIVSIPPGI